MYAIVRAGGRQEKVAVGDLIELDRVVGQPGDEVSLPVLLLVDNGAVTTDAAVLAKSTVKGELVECQQFGSGQRRFFLNNAAPVRDAEGNIIAGVVAEMDVTEQRRWQQAVEASEVQIGRAHV